MRNRLLATVVLGMALLGVALPASAGPITSLFNTGVDGSGTVLANGTLGDPHYSLIQVPSGSTQTRVFTSASGFPIPPYLGDNTTSRWIMPNNGSSGDWTSPVGTYVYRTTFDLSGMIASTAQITGGWTSDNDGIKILLNGVQVAGPTASNQFQVGFAPFSMSSGFLAGVNTLDFYINNASGSSGNPTALRVQMSGTAQAVPDGGTTLVLLGGAMTLIAALRRRSL